MYCKRHSIRKKSSRMQESRRVIDRDGFDALAPIVQYMLSFFFCVQPIQKKLFPDHFGEEKVESR